MLRVNAGKPRYRDIELEHAVGGFSFAAYAEDRELDLGHDIRQGKTEVTVAISRRTVTAALRAMDARWIEICIEGPGRPVRIWSAQNQEAAVISTKPLD